MDAAEWNVRGLAGLSWNASGRVSATKRKTTTAQIKNLQLNIRKLIAQNNREEINLVGSWLTDVFYNIFLQKGFSFNISVQYIYLLIKQFLRTHRVLNFTQAYRNKTSRLHITMQQNKLLYYGIIKTSSASLFVFTILCTNRHVKLSINWLFKMSGTFAKCSEGSLSLPFTIYAI